MATANMYDEQAAFETAYDEGLEEQGRVNVLVVGATGAGKSTLINAVFSGDVCQIGIGKPVTQDTTYYAHPTGRAGFFDTRGIEFGDGRERILKWLRKEVKDRQDKPVEDQIHVAWYCIRATDLRLDQGQLDFISALKDLGIPVILVLTKVPLRAQDNAFAPDVVEFAHYLAHQDLPIVGGEPILTAARADEFAGTAEHGLNALLSATASAVPAEVLSALYTTQRLNLKVKRSRATGVIHVSAVTAAATGFIPVPGADLAALVPIEVAMVAKISSVYGLPVDTQQLIRLVGPAIFGGGLLRAASTFLRSALKVIPGSDLVVGPVSAALSAALTEAIGLAWVGVCEFILRNDPTGQDLPSPEYLRALFNESLRRHREGTTLTAVAA